ncbi:MAG TPA: PepSY domain-containing protein [Candidatus Acidoferrum sp.]
MRSRTILVICAGILMLAVGGQIYAQTAAPKKSKIPASLKSEAKLSVEDAREIAAKKVPGTIKEEELEKENGKLVYSFDIQVKGEKDITEVQVSAIDGSIVSVEKENAAAEANQKKQDANKKTSGS